MCDPSAIINLNNAGSQDGITLSYIGTLERKSGQMEPPPGCEMVVNDGGTGFEVAHTFSVPIKADLLFSTDNPVTYIDTVLYSLPTCMLGTAPAGSVCDDDVGGGYTSSIVVAAVDAGTTTTVVVDTWSVGSVPPDGGLYQLDVRVRPIVGVGASCDPRLVLNHCDVGLSCNPASQTCSTAAAPTITAVSFLTTPNPNSTWRVVISGTDPNQDVVNFDAEFLDAANNVLTDMGTSVFTLDFDTPVFGQATFRGVIDHLLLNFAPPAAAIRVALRDSAGNMSAKVTQALVAMPTQSVGHACDTTGVLDMCTSGSVCKPAASGSTTGTCTPGTAPVITTATAEYGSAASLFQKVFFKGTDAEGDVKTLLARYVFTDGGLLRNSDGSVRVDEQPFTYVQGSTSFQGYSAIMGATAVTPPVAGLRVTLQDATGRESNSSDVEFFSFPERTPGQACDIRRFDDICSRAAPACSGTCQTAAAVTAQACGAAPSLTLGVPVTSTLGFGPNRWVPPCASLSDGSEAVYKFTLGAASDVTFSTDFPETTIDSIVYISSSCAPTLNVMACFDSTSTLDPSTNAVIKNLAPGTYYVFVDSWRRVQGAGTGTFKLLVNGRSMINTAGAPCDPLLVANRCAGALKCKPNATYSAYTCQ
jgi:hypothetical protein